MSEISLSVADAKARILETFTPLELEPVPLISCLGRVLGESIVVEFDIPSDDRSAMDGFALRADDIQSAKKTTPIRLKVIEDIRAGAIPEQTLETGQASRIMTGAVLPEGADAVIPVEFTSVDAPMLDTEIPAEIAVFEPLAEGDYVRPRGQDVRSGATILTPGQRLLEHEIAMLATLGKQVVQVHRKPRVGILSTGDELLGVAEPMEAGKIRDSNSYALHAAVQRVGAEPTLLGISRDDPDSLRSKLDAGLEQGADLLLTTAGVSVGAYDYVREVVLESGSLMFWKVNLRPGKPLLVGSYREVPIFGLPGNPVSVAVTFQLFVRPALERMLGLMVETNQRVYVELDHEVRSDSRESYLRAQIWWEGEGYRARLTGSQDSGVLSSLVKANALVRVPAGETRVAAGGKMEAWILDGAFVPLIGEEEQRYE